MKPIIFFVFFPLRFSITIFRIVHFEVLLKWFLQETTEAIDLEITLAIAALPAELQRNFKQLYNPFNLTELKTTFPSIIWETYMGTLLRGVLLSCRKKKVDLKIDLTTKTE